MKMRGYTNVHKGLTGLAVLAMVAIDHQWETPTAWVCLALHGTFGLLRVWKSRVFPDKSWERQASLCQGLVIWFGLTLYWMITSGGVQGPYGLVAIAIGVFVVGLFLHFTPDNQKPTAQSLQPERLITTGMMARSRNPYSFGELLIYLALLAMHWLPLVVPLGYVILVWGPNMRRKDRSLARYAAFGAHWRGTRQILLFIPSVHSLARVRELSIDRRAWPRCGAKDPRPAEPWGEWLRQALRRPGLILLAQGGRERARP